MYIPGWLIIVFIVVAILFYIKYRSENPPTGAMWKEAEANMQIVLDESFVPEGDELQVERKFIKTMEVDMKLLRERYKDNPEKLKQIARDWMNYSDAIVQKKTAREMLIVAHGDDVAEAIKDVQERSERAIIVIEEITKRIEKELGKDSNIKKIQNK
ncbi:hypothetical protein ACFL2V_22050 [Pseudomonadota bacterium]